MYAYPALDELLAEAREAARGHGHGITANGLAGLALELAAIHTAVTHALEPLKERLREEARALLSEESGTVTIDGYYSEEDSEDILGTVTVTFPDKQVKLPKGTDIPTLKHVLGPYFGEYFQESTTYRPTPDFRTTVKSRIKSGHSDAQSALAAVSLIDPTPRVGFKPSGSVGPEEEGL